jgi:hypothetical protein
MTSAFFFGLVTQRAVSCLPTFSWTGDDPDIVWLPAQFLAEWQAPVPLDVIFDSPYLNWSHSSFTTERHRVLGRKQVADAAADLDIIHFDRLAVDATFGSVSWNAKRDRPLTPGFELRDLAYRSPWIKVRCAQTRQTFTSASLADGYLLSRQNSSSRTEAWSTERSSTNI